MVRLLAFAMLLNGAAVAQSICPEKIDVLTLSGFVLDGANERPIAGASIHFRGKGDEFDQDHREVNPPTLLGEVKTNTDGSFSIPCLPPGSFNIRATAQGYFGARDVFGPKPAGSRPNMGLAMPAEGVLRLQPDLLGLRVMPDAALARLNQQEGGYSGVSYPTPAFTSDGSRIAFLVAGSAPSQGDSTEEAPSPGGCAALAYDLSNGRLTDMSNSLPANYCGADSTEIAWEGDAVYVEFTDYNSTPNKTEAMWLQGGKTAPLPVGDLPKSFQQRLTRKAANGAADREAEEKMKAETVETTNDGRFTLTLSEGDIGQCNSLVAASKQPKWEQTVTACAFPFDYKLDRSRDLLFYTEPALLVEFNFKTRSQRKFPLPESEVGPDLLAFQPLSSGATRMVYTVNHAECDPAASDKVGSSAESGTDLSSVCFITIPAP